MTARAAAVQALVRLVEQPEDLGLSDCETVRDGWVGQPVNAVTSFAFVAGGAWLGTRLGGLERRERTAAGAYAALLAVTGLGSVAYHGPQFGGAQLLHDLPIVGVLGVGAAVPLLRRRRGERALPGWSPGRALATVTAGAVGVASYVSGGTEGPLCRPDSLVQLHGLWHVATAVSLTLWATMVWDPASEVAVEEVVEVADG